MMNERLAILKQTYGRLRPKDLALDPLISSIETSVDPDDCDEALSYSAQVLMEEGRFEDAEALISRISEDWRGEAAELLALLASKLVRAGQGAKALRLLIRGLRLSFRSGNSRWVEALTLVDLARAAMEVQSADFCRAILLEAAALAQTEIAGKNPQDSLDSMGTLGDICIALVEAGFAADARRLAAGVPNKERRQQILTAIHHGA